MNAESTEGLQAISPAKKVKIEEGNQMLQSFPHKVQNLVKNLAATKQNLIKCQQELDLSNKEHQIKETKIKKLEEKLKIFENDENKEM